MYIDIYIQLYKCVCIIYKFTTYNSKYYTGKSIRNVCFFWIVSHDETATVIKCTVMLCNGTNKRFAARLQKGTWLKLISPTNFPESEMWIKNRLDFKRPRPMGREDCEVARGSVGMLLRCHASHLQICFTSIVMYRDLIVSTRCIYKYRRTHIHLYTYMYIMMDDVFIFPFPRSED